MVSTTLLYFISESYYDTLILPVDILGYIFIHVMIVLDRLEQWQRRFLLTVVQFFSSGDLLYGLAGSLFQGPMSMFCSLFTEKAPALC